MAHVFISYKKQDRKFIDLLEQKIKESDIDVWTDAHIQAGENWREKIDEAIHESFVLLVYMTKKARSSQYVTYEWAYALGKGIPVVTVVGEKMELHPKLQIFQYLDFTERGGESWEELINILTSLRQKSERVIIPIDASPEMRQIMLALGSWNPNVRSQSLEVLGLKKYKGAEKQIIQMLNTDDDLRVRAMAAFALGQITHSSSILLENLNQQKIVKKAVIEALSNFSELEVVTSLINLIESDLDC